jgi:5'-3' exonuclease
MWPMARRFQADDALATAASWYARDERVEQVVICTTDKDLAQCVEGERVVLLDRIRKTTMNAAGVRERFGVVPASIPDWFALVGDASDGLPGLPGWGARSAAAVLDRYRRIEAVPEDAGDWDVEVRGAARLAETLRARRREAILYRDLSVLRRDVPLRDTLDDLEWCGADRETLEPLVEMLGEPEVLPRIARWR